MTRQTDLRPRALAVLAAALAVATIVSCGGGGVVGSGGTGRAAGVTVGTVNGFGSVIVDGVTYDNRGAPVLTEVAPGEDAIAEVKLGHRVAVDYETNGVASAVHLDTALIGPVASVTSVDRFSILGQTVTVNASAAAGPVTQFGGGYSQASDVRAGDPIEVHGLLVRQTGTYLFQATRIDKLAAAPAYLRVTGLVSSLSTGATVTLTLGALSVDGTGAIVLPSAGVLAEGQMVTVLALPGTLTMPGVDTWRLKAAQIRIRGLRDAGLDDYVSGAVSHLDAQAKTFTLESLRVNYAAATVTPATLPLANGQYVQLRAKVGDDGSLVASVVAIRDGRSGSEAELRGNISAYDPTTRRFSVRGVTVDAIGASVEGCPATGLADALFVEIHGSLSSSGVVAQTVHCEDEPSGATVEREGSAAAVDVAGKRFSLAPQQGAAVNVTWTDTTFFGGVTPQTLAGRSVHVEGTLVGTVLLASKVKLDD